MSKSNFIPDEKWCEDDDFTLRLSSSINPLDQGRDGLSVLLSLIESLGEELRPEFVVLDGRKLQYSQDHVWEYLDEMRVGSCTMVMLCRERAPAVDFTLYLQETQRPERLLLELRIRPFSWIQDPNRVHTCTRTFVELARAFAQRFPVSEEESAGHSAADSDVPDEDERHSLPQRIHRVYWLNLYGQRMVAELGRERVLSTPSAHVEELPGGAVLLLTRPTPADFASEEARLAQARALVHLRPELNLDEVLETLRQRSLAFVPVPIAFDEDVADILHKEMAYSGLSNRRKEIERFNRYRPPPVTEWLPVEQVPASDVEDVRQAIDTYEGLHAEQFVALMFADKVPGVMEGTLDALPAVDFHLWHFRWGGRFADEDRAELEKALGAWLGMYLVHFLKGRWVPRRALEQTAVVVGSRAWLPFVRARHALERRESPLDSSCTQLFREARRFSGVLFN